MRALIGMLRTTGAGTNGRYRRRQASFSGRMVEVTCRRLSGASRVGCASRLQLQRSGCRDVVSEVVKAHLPSNDVPTLALDKTVARQDPWVLPDSMPAALRQAALAARDHSPLIDVVSPSLTAFWGRPIDCSVMCCCFRAIRHRLTSAIPLCIRTGRTSPVCHGR